MMALPENITMRGPSPKDQLCGGAEHPCDLCQKGRYGADLCFHENDGESKFYVDTASLFDFGFENFEKVSISEEEKGYREDACRGAGAVM